MDIQDKIKDALRRCMEAGVCHTHHQFADMVGLNTATLSKALNGDKAYCTVNLLRRVEYAMAKAGVSFDGENTIEKMQRDIEALKAEIAEIKAKMVK